MKGLESFLKRIQEDPSNRMLIDSFIHLLDECSLELKFSYYLRLVLSLISFDKRLAQKLARKAIKSLRGSQRSIPAVSKSIHQLEAILKELERDQAQQSKKPQEDQDITVIIAPKQVENQSNKPLPDPSKEAQLSPRPARPIELFVDKLKRANEALHIANGQPSDFFKQIDQNGLFSITYQIIELIDPVGMTLQPPLTGWIDVIEPSELEWLQQTKLLPIEKFTSQTHLNISAVFLQETHASKAFDLFTTLADSKKSAMELCVLTTGHLQQQGLHFRVLKIWQGLGQHVLTIDDATLAYQALCASWKALGLQGFLWSSDEGIETFKTKIAQRIRPNISGILIGLE